MCYLLSADHLYLCHNFLEVCKLNSCAESLLVLTEVDEGIGTSSTLSLVVNPIKRFADAAFSEFTSFWLFFICIYQADFRKVLDQVLCALDFSRAAPPHRCSGIV